MKIDTERLLRGVWLVNGIILLLFLLVAGVMVIGNVLRTLGADEAAVRVASRPPAAAREPRAVRYSTPKSIRGTASRIALVHDGEGHQAGASPAYAAPVVNAIFLGPGEGRLLLERPGYIGAVRLPQDAWSAGSTADSAAARTYIAYDLALDDANRDGVLDARDPLTLYVSDLAGRGLRRVLPAGLRYRDSEPLDARRLLVVALEEGDGKGADPSRLRQRAFVYEVDGGGLSPYGALDSLAQQAGRLLQR